MAERARLPDPMKRVFHERLDERLVQTMWTEVRSSIAPRRRARAIAPYAGLACALGVSLLLFVFWPREPRIVERAPLICEGGQQSVEPAQLRLVGGLDLAELENSSGRRDFEDGSFVVLDPDTELLALENDAHQVTFLLRRGRVAFSVMPHGPRRWVIECGLLTVEVVGTRFSIMRDARAVRISVDEGTVLVRGERVPEGIARLTAGQQIEVLTQAPARSRVERHPIQASRRDGSGPDALWLRADEARAANDPQRAVRLLERLVVEHPEHSSAALAAFTWGRLELEQLDHPERAVRAFLRAIDLGLPEPLLLDCRKHLASARARITK